VEEVGEGWENAKKRDLRRSKGNSGERICAKEKDERREQPKEEGKEERPGGREKGG